MKDVNEILKELKTEGQEPAIDYDNLPEERGQYVPPPQPGDYRFKLPADLTKNWDLGEYEKDGQKYQVATMVFNDDAPLTIVQAAQKANEQFVGQSPWVRISTRRRKRGKDGPEVSDTTYLARALDPKARPQSIKDFIEFFRKQGGREFVAAGEYTGFCNPKKPAKVQLEDPQTHEVTLEIKQDAQGNPVNGCGNNYYQSDWPKGADGLFASTMTCGCGALIYPFFQLARFRSVVPGAK